MSNDQKPEPKQYNLTSHEANMLRFVNNHQNAIFSGLLSTIAGSRLGYTVTERTQFNLSGDFNTMTLMELDIPEEAKAPTEDSGSPVVTAPEPAKEDSSEENQPTVATEPSTPSVPTTETTAPDDSEGAGPDKTVGATEPTVPSEPKSGDSDTAGQPPADLKPEAPAETTQQNAPSEPKSDTNAS